MKRFLFILAVLFAAVSCFDDSVTKQSYTMVATFEYTGADFGKDSTHFDTQFGYGAQWNDLLFSHKVDMDNEAFLGGFMLSRLKASTEEGADGTYRVNAAYGNGKSDTYMVFQISGSASNMPDKAISFLYSAYGTCTPVGCYVNNTVAVTEAVKANFKDGDVLMLKAIGYAGETRTGEVSMKLAEYTEAKDSIVSTWTPFDMSSLGSIETIDFEVISTNDAVPAFFCMDDMTASISLEY